MDVKLRKCPHCGERASVHMTERRASGYWRRHVCKNGRGQAGCGERFASVVRDDGSIDVYDRVAPSDLWEPHTEKIAHYDAPEVKE